MEIAEKYINSLHIHICRNTTNKTTRSPKIWIDNNSNLLITILSILKFSPPVLVN